MSRRVGVTGAVISITVTNADDETLIGHSWYVSQQRANQIAYTLGEPDQTVVMPAERMGVVTDHFEQHAVVVNDG